MNFKLALVAAAAVGVASSAQAADLAKKAPAAANYVKVCDAQGAGFFYIPGSDTCLKIAGYVRAEMRVGGYDGSYAGKTNGMGPHRGENGIYSRARANINFDARTATEYGLLRSYIELWATQGSGDTSPTMALRAGFVQFAGITAGRAQSFFDFVEGNYSIGNIEADSSDRRVNQLAYTFSFGNGITATAALEDYSTDDATASLRPANTIAGGVKYPDLVGVLAITQAWGRAQIMGAIHDNYGLTQAGVARKQDKVGYVIGGGLEFNLPMIAAGDKVFVQAVYSQGALGYALINNPKPTTAVLATDFGYDGASLKQSTVWSTNFGFHHEFNPMWETNIGGSFVKYDDFLKAKNNDFTQAIANFDVRWKPAKNFYIGVAVDYLHVDYKNAAYKDANAIQGTFRLQRNF